MNKKFTVQRGFAALKTTAALIASAALLTACTADDTTAAQGTGGNAIRLTANISGAATTRSNTENTDLAVNNTQFAGGAKVRLFLDNALKLDGVAGPTSTPTTATTYEDVSAPAPDGNRQFVLSGTYNWPTIDGTADFYGYYPVHNDITPTNHNDADKAVITVSTAQGAAEAPKLSNPSGVSADLLYAVREDVKRYVNPVPLTFRHQMARVSLTLEAGECMTADQLTDAMVTLSGMFCSANLTKGTYTVAAITDDAENYPARTVVLKNADVNTLQHYCLLPPGQQLTGRTLNVSQGSAPPLVVTMPQLDGTDVSLEAGYDYQLTIKVTATELKLMTYEIHPWTFATTFSSLDNQTHQPLTITNTSGGENTVTFQQATDVAPKAVSYTVYNADGTVVSTGLTNVSGTSPVNTQITLQKGQYVQFLGDNDAYSKSEHNRNTCTRILASAAHTASGNVMSLINSVYYPDLTEFPGGRTLQFHGLFVANNKLTDASRLMLPAQTLTESCYQAMFCDCTALTEPPVLPATTLADYCYYQMFQGCTSLVKTPALPAMTMANNCYRDMFNNCKNLTAAPALPAKTMADSCYRAMFLECTALTAPPALPAMTLAGGCYFEMFGDCRNLKTAPALPATTLEGSCYHAMFLGCTSLVTPPALPAKKAPHYCYEQMFQGCTSLTSVPALPATDLGFISYRAMFKGCTSLTTVPKDLLPFKGQTHNGVYQSMFEGCSNLTNAPDLPAYYVSVYAYTCMFKNCTSLLEAPELPATGINNAGYYQMFYGCRSLVKAPSILPCTSLVGPTDGWARVRENGVYQEMFKGCTSLEKAPVLPATSLSARCYEGMFEDCSKLAYLRCNANAGELTAVKFHDMRWHDNTKQSSTATNMMKGAGSNNGGTGKVYGHSGILDELKKVEAQVVGTTTYYGPTLDQTDNWSYEGAY